MNEKTRNLFVRSATGALFVAVMMAAMLVSRLSFAILLLCIAAGCMREFYGMTERNGARPRKFAGTVIGLLLVTANLCLVEAIVNDAAFLKYAAMALAAVILVVPFTLVHEIWSRDENPIRNLGATFLGVVYVAFPVSLMAFFPIAGSKAFFLWDPMVVPSFVLIVWANDVFAYLSGITMGRHKMFERVSPKKTWEGFFGGIAGAVAVSALCGRFLVGGNIWVWMGLGAVVALASVLGDLLESHFKRSAGVKDSGRMLPGHGGLLDRFDAMLLAVPFVFIFFVLALMMNGANLLQNLPPR